MWGAVWNFVDGFLSTHGALVAVAATWLWHHISSSKTSWVEDKVQEAAEAAWNLALLGADVGIPLPALLDRARQLAHDKIARLSIPLSKSILALIDHELDVLAGKLAADHLEQQMHDVADEALDVTKVWADAAKRGADIVAGASDVVSTEVVPQDAPPLTAPSGGTVAAPSSDANAASSLHATSGSTDSPTTASPSTLVIEQRGKPTELVREP